jgi:hypothetical protein
LPPKPLALATNSRFKGNKEMKTALMTLITLAISFLSTNTALAQNKPLACQQDASGGLKWENGKWVSAKFVSNYKFILVQTNDSLTPDSVAKALGHDYVNQVSCGKNTIRISCQDKTGGNLFFDPKTMKGATSQLFGSTSNNPDRDTVSVDVFFCTPF